MHARKSGFGTCTSVHVPNNHYKSLDRVRMQKLFINQIISFFLHGKQMGQLLLCIQIDTE